MSDLIDILKVIHIVSAVLMAWPYYALVTVNQRARLGPPLGDRLDTYVENIIKNRTIPCFVFQATALITGLALVLLQGHGMDALVTNPVLGIKFLLLLLIAVLLLYVHISLQPRIDALFAGFESAPVPAEVVPNIGSLRLVRKRIASICLFSVLTMVMLGVQVWAGFPLWISGALIFAIVVFTWRSYRSVTPYGWGK